MIYYVRLLSKRDYGSIVRMDDDVSEHIFKPSRGWERTGILMDYQWPDALYDGQYEFIDEETALSLIAEQEARHTTQ